MASVTKFDPAQRAIRSADASTKGARKPHRPNAPEPLLSPSRPHSAAPPPRPSPRTPRAEANSHPGARGAPDLRWAPCALPVRAPHFLCDKCALTERLTETQPVTNWLDVR